MEGRLVAVNDVELQARNGTESQMLWFYGELVGLRCIETPGEDSRRLRFKSDRIELCITFTESTDVESIDFRVHCAVPSIDEAAERLAERKYPFDEVRGLAGTDRALSLLDPAGHRVELRRSWPNTMV